MPKVKKTKPHAVQAQVEKRLTRNSSKQSNAEATNGPDPNSTSEPIDSEGWENAKSIFEFEANDIDGKKTSLEKYKGFVTIIVNVASHCGYTKANYTGLNELFEEHSESGLRIAAFPCNQFKNQEKGDSATIKEFCKKRDVKFDLFEKINVNGKTAHPLYKYLKHTLGNDEPISWNFDIFLVSKDGVPAKRYKKSKNPKAMEPDILAELEK